MPTLLDTYNPSILAIPVLHILAILPHGYALSVATGGHPTRWDNRNPRSTDLKSKLSERLSADDFALYERLEACSANGMENLPLFATAVILGNMAGLKKDGIWGMTGFAASFLAVRVLYTAAYVGGKTQGLSFVRSGLWTLGVGLCWRVIIKSAKALGGARL
ncbi:uncharacterized protein EI97DRAFT_378025 [Westerdykella ornata]|uniref:Membrane-associated proteins in eicosanoid and glutathione metabolism n=1 Tax=Westerdykella ornata TaxID=318751 RepID=A0A6A6JI35_WESOR|nr:uncharacterized protein EI97DRAFT_378025 [Westerdykella ornata]KAF2276057.1 hypothetical protein EI97DRAFT_378025 [Westerdykella ornata]